MAIQRFFRLLEGFSDQLMGEVGLARWSARGEIGKVGPMYRKPLLRMQVQANPVPVCPRCNEFFVYPINRETVLQIVKSEADRDDNFASGQQSLKVSVPYVPKSDVCAGQPVAAYESFQEIVIKTPSPIAVLE